MLGKYPSRMLAKAQELNSPASGMRCRNDSIGMCKLSEMHIAWSRKAPDIAYIYIYSSKEECMMHVLFSLKQCQKKHALQLLDHLILIRGLSTISQEQLARRQTLLHSTLRCNHCTRRRTHIRRWHHRNHRYIATSGPNM